ncbi:MAG TPA: twin-arginine translocase TatA/TatE family subunit [Chloroflexota bacterium]|nr:twin-arginine translocase TatA/TatE family subunit [Chloroflexota bacterium]
MDNIFGIGMPELILILIIAGVVMGPERIGKVARWLGKTSAQLQLISRSFMRQLNNELEGLDDGRALRDAMDEVQLLRQELKSLRQEFTSITTTTVQEGKMALDEIENSIQPPSLKPIGGDGPAAGTNNGAHTKTAPQPSALPKPVDVPGDSEE